MWKENFLFGVGWMKYNCDWCGKDLDSDIDGVITMHEKAPLHESCNDELYNMCSYLCLRKWLGMIEWVMD